MSGSYYRVDKGSLLSCVMVIIIMGAVGSLEVLVPPRHHTLELCLTVRLQACHGTPMIMIMSIIIIICLNRQVMHH